MFPHLTLRRGEGSPPALFAPRQSMQYLSRGEPERDEPGTQVGARNSAMPWEAACQSVTAREALASEATWVGEGGWAPPKPVRLVLLGNDLMTKTPQSEQTLQGIRSEENDRLVVQELEVILEVMQGTRYNGT